MKDIVVTGAFGGMGRATVKALRDAGFRVFALDKEVLDCPEGVIPVRCDISTSEGVAAAFNKVCESTDSVYAIIHFAGVYMLDSLVEMSEDEFERIFKVNLFGAYLINKTFLPLLSNGARIIITTSELAVLDPLPFTGVYAVSKAALDKYAYSLCMELQLSGIFVSVLRAGAVSTGMLGVSTDALDRFCKKTERYSFSADRFKSIVERVEARSVSPEKIAAKALKILSKKHPSFAYCINRNPLLLLLDACPKRLQLFAIGRLLKK